MRQCVPSACHSCQARLSVRMALQVGGHIGATNDGSARDNTGHSCPGISPARWECGRFSIGRRYSPVVPDTEEVNAPRDFLRDRRLHSHAVPGRPVRAGSVAHWDHRGTSGHQRSPTAKRTCRSTSLQLRQLAQRQAANQIVVPKVGGSSFLGTAATPLAAR
jgi:hypothetical protein